MIDKSGIESKIGYTFKDDTLLTRALTHGSAESDPNKNYQRLEFLGDSIVDFIVAKHLMEIYEAESEGALTRMRSAIVSEQPLADAMTALGIAQNLIVGSGEKKQGIAELDSIKADLFEAITAAIYLDSGSIEASQTFVLTALNAAFASSDKAKKMSDPKSEINEYAAKHSVEAEYVELEKSGPAHDLYFKYCVKINGDVMGEGEGKTKREAQQNAASNAIKSISKK